MRTGLYALVLILAATNWAAAGDWSHYDNARYGYGIDIPPDFEAMGEADNGDGQQFRGGFGTQVLTVFGANVIADGFEAEVAQRQSWAEEAGWTLTYQAATPSWASYSGTNGARVSYARVIALCGGTQIAMFELEYFASDSAELAPVVDRLVRSLKASDGTC